MYISVDLMSMLWHRATLTTHKGTDKSSWIKWGSNSLLPDWDNIDSSQLSTTFVSCHRNCVKTQSNDIAVVAFDNWQPVWNAHVVISTPVCQFELLISYHIISHHITSRHVASRHVTPCHVISYHIISYHIISSSIYDNYHKYEYHSP